MDTATTRQPADLSYDTLLARAGGAVDTFLERVRDVPYEEKGVFFSEMLFVYAAVGADHAGPVLESGRARGQSTCVLAHLFPKSKITSVEFDRDSPDVPIAEGRLKDFKHVTLLYGDSQKLLFDHLQPGAAVIIDGPKGFRALRLALQLLRTSQVRMVFVHDVYQGLPTRRFVEQYVPGALFSDHGAFVERFKHLDERCWESFRDAGALEWQPAGVEATSYGPTFACLPYDRAVSYTKLLAQLHLANFFARTGKTLSKRLDTRGDG